MVPIEKVTEDDPEGIVTVAGTVALIELDETLTTMPLEPAFPLTLTLPDELVPPTTVAGEMMNPAKVAGFSVRFAVNDVVASVAVSVSVTIMSTPTVPIGNVAVLDPAGTVTVAGTEALGVEESETTVPPTGAGAVRVTVPVELLPPRRLVGATVKLCSPPGMIVRELCVVTP